MSVLRSLTLLTSCLMSLEFLKPPLSYYTCSALIFGLSLVFTLLETSFSLKKIFAWSAGLVLFSASLAFLFGLPINSEFSGVLIWSTIFAAFSLQPIVLHDKAEHLLFGHRSEWSELAAVYPSVGAAAGAWLGCIPLPLDVDEPWKTWPTPCVYGCLAGHLGVLLCLVATRLFSVIASDVHAAGRKEM